MQKRLIQTEVFTADQSYQSVWERQQERVEQRLRGDIPDTLLLGEHPLTITTGRGLKPESLLTSQIPFIPIERGGDVTLHAPGQLIAYPIFLLPPEHRDLHAFLRQLETIVIDTLATFHLSAFPHSDGTGVWVSTEIGPSQKIASIGIAVKRWVTYHGLALNVCNPLSDFQAIRPCGFDSSVMTSMSEALQRDISVEEVILVMQKRFMTVFNQA